MSNDLPLINDAREVRHPLGQLAYETYCDPNNEANKLYPTWGQLYPEQRAGWQRAAEAVWVAAFQAGADSVVLESLNER